jgi:hypothetical protein
MRLMIDCHKTDREARQKLTAETPHDLLPNSMVTFNVAIARLAVPPALRAADVARPSDMPAPLPFASGHADRERS